MTVLSAMHTILPNKVETVIASTFRTYETFTKILSLLFGFMRQVNWAFAIGAAFPKHQLRLGGAPRFLYIGPGSFNGTLPYLVAGDAYSFDHPIPIRLSVIILGVRDALNKFIVDHIYIVLVLALIIGATIGVRVVFLLHARYLDTPIPGSATSPLDIALEKDAPYDFCHSKEALDAQANVTLPLPTSPSIDLNIPATLGAGRLGLGITLPTVDAALNRLGLEPALDLEIPVTLDTNNVGLGITVPVVDTAVYLDIAETFDTQRIGLGITTGGALHDMSVNDDDDEEDEEYFDAEELLSIVPKPAESSQDMTEDLAYSVAEYPSDVFCNAGDSTCESIHTEHEFSFDSASPTFASAPHPINPPTLPLPPVDNDSFELPSTENARDSDQLMDISFENHLPSEDYVNLIPEEKDAEYHRVMIETMKRRKAAFDRRQKAPAPAKARASSPSDDDRRIIELLRPWEDQLCQEFLAIYPDAPVEDFMPFLRTKAEEFKEECLGE